MTEEQPVVERVVHCDNCGCNIFDEGIIEVTSGGLAETDITFFLPYANIGDTCIKSFTDQESRCRKCGNTLCAGQITSSEIMDFYEGHTDYLESYIRFKGGSPVHGW